MRTHADHLEVEVKFFVSEPEALRRRLLAEADLVAPRIFETNLRYDNAGRDLVRRSCLLRLRRDRECRLTFKSKADDGGGQFKVHRELEVAVGDGDTMHAILQALGYTVVQRYEKWREAFAWDDVLVCLDTMPFGDFVEIEGDGSGIREAARRLGLAWETRILDNYLRIFDLLRRKAGLPFTDVTFDNFQRHPASLGRYEDVLNALKSG